MRRIATVLVLPLFIAGCMAIIADPNERVHSLNLTVDADGALQSKECAAVAGSKACDPYPNPMDCATLRVDVTADGRTYMECKGKSGKMIDSGYASIVEGMPFICKARKDNSCQICADLYGKTVFDNCNRNPQLYRRTGSGWGQTMPDHVPGVPVEPNPPAGSETTTQPPKPQTPTPPKPETPKPPPAKPEPPKPETPTPPKPEPPKPTPPKPEPPKPATPPPASSSMCDPNNAIAMYARNFNHILQSDGQGFSWVPARMSSPRGGFWSGSSRYTCASVRNSRSYMTQCATRQAGRCFCWGGSRSVCKCSRIPLRALQMACAGIPAECDRGQWEANLIMAMGQGSQFLWKGARTGRGPSQIPGIDAASFRAPSCQGSPLVLDLAGDGVEPTSVEKGVDFDLMGHGALKTAWVKGDDALLVLDRNNDGKIDSGTELFGEATVTEHGLPAPDGFAALAQLDAASAGGNGNGVLEADDIMYGELRLWRDANGDGVSQPAELSTLKDAGVASIEVTARQRCTDDDGHGNDIGTRANFTRTDGRKGTVVDVYFATKND